MVAAVLIVGVAAGLCYLFPNVTHNILSTRARQTSVSLALSHVQEYKSKPYFLIPPTPAATPGLNAATCDCNTFDSSLYPASAPFTEQLSADGKTFTRQTCVNLVGMNRQPQCPLVNGTISGDPGLKNVVVRVSWAVNNASFTYQTATLVSQSTHGSWAVYPASLTVILCNDTGAGVCSNPAPASSQVTDSSLNNVEIDLFNQLNFSNKLYDASAGQAVMPIPAGSGYTLYVSDPRFFPYHLDGLAFNPGDVGKSIVIPLKSTTTYSSTVVGEAFISDHLVISKVVGGIAKTVGCTSVADDDSELIEIYNPTKSVYKIGGSGPANISLYFDNAPSGVTAENFTDTSLFSL